MDCSYRNDDVIFFLWILTRFLLLFCYDRKRLFSLINDQPTLFEVVTGRKSVKDNKPSVDSGSKSRNSAKVETLLRTLSNLFIR